jgi:head-tail adaptor
MRTLFLDPGALRSELALQANTPVPDGLGGHMESWVEIATVFARIAPVSATSSFGPDQTVEEVMRFAKQGRIFDIVTVHDPDDTGRYLVCRAREAGL